MKAMTAKQYRKARIGLDLTQEELAKQLEVSVRQVSRRETGETPINREAEFAIAHLKSLWY